MTQEHDLNPKIDLIYREASGISDALKEFDNEGWLLEEVGLDALTRKTLSQPQGELRLVHSLGDLAEMVGIDAKVAIPNCHFVGFEYFGEGGNPDRILFRLAEISVENDDKLYPTARESEMQLGRWWGSDTMWELVLDDNLIGLTAWQSSEGAFQNLSLEGGRGNQIQHVQVYKEIGGSRNFVRRLYPSGDIFGSQNVVERLVVEGIDRLRRRLDWIQPETGKMVKSIEVRPTGTRSVVSAIIANEEMGTVSKFLWVNEGKEWLYEYEDVMEKLAPELWKNDDFLVKLEEIRFGYLVWLSGKYVGVAQEIEKIHESRLCDYVPISWREMLRPTTWDSIGSQVADVGCRSDLKNPKRPARTPGVSYACVLDLLGKSGREYFPTVVLEGGMPVDLVLESPDPGSRSV